jgi:hypothetical protein
LEIPDIIARHYQEQINQAVGRNRGFRESPDRETKTVVVASRRLWNNVLRHLGGLSSRVQMFEVPGRLL